MNETERLIHRIWREVGFSAMLTSFADVIEKDTNMLPTTPKYRQEREMKIALIKQLREAAGWVEE